MGIFVNILCNCVMDCIISVRTTSYNMGSLDTAGTTLCLDWVSSSSMSVYITTVFNLCPAILSSTSTIRGDLVSTPTFVCMGLCVGFIPTSSA